MPRFSPSSPFPPSMSQLPSRPLLLSLNLSLKARQCLHAFAAAGVVLISACASQPDQEAAATSTGTVKNADDLLVVDCLLPGQVRKLGASSTYMTARRPIKTTAVDCEIRGGEYVAFDRADYATALKMWLPIAQGGDAEAQTYVGEIFEKGLGIQPDYAAAAMWYQKAAAQNFSRAQINLGNLYEKGLGVPMDKSIALNWYRKASGINNDQIAYSSTFEVQAQAQQQQLNQLKQEVSQKNQRLEQLQSQLASTQQQLKTQKQSLVDAQQRQHDKELALLAQESKAINQQSKETIAKLRAELEASKAEVDRQQTRLANLNTQAETVSSQLASSDAAANASATASAPLLATADSPAIEIIDPPMSLMRGLPTVTLRAGTTKKEIVGKIKAPKGISSLKINGQPQPVDDYSLFWVDVPVKGLRTPVKIEAVDKAGKSIAFDFSLVTEEQKLEKSEKLVQASSLKVASNTQLGNFHALVIGNNTYQYYPTLQTAVNDAEETAKILREKYGFDTVLLKNANRFDILSELNKLRESLKPEDNLLIYYAGHGELDETNDRGYWLPVDAAPGDTTNWISNVSISDILNTLAAKHVLVVADSCYAGKLSQAAVPRVDVEMSPEAQQEWIRIMAKARARTALTSGGVQPVLDNGGGGHSIFAGAFLESLAHQDGVIDGYSLYREVLGKVRTRAKALNQQQIPEYAPLRYAGHEAGEFFFQAQ